MTLAIGDIAPDFELPDASRTPVRLGDFKGKKHLLVVFFPFAFTGICTRELCAIRDDLTEARGERVETIAISCNATATLGEFAKQNNYEFPILSDFWPHGAVSKSYGVFNEDMGCAERGSFIIDPDGVIQWTVHKPVDGERDAEGAHKALADLGAL